ncbi:RNA-directed DNA polymerase [Corynebacterium breve]|uniref:RNA-directed DNA polymerase n=1 Tax=Corynebacterium breve TaxID=3049799 RepID=A0ABY8VHJ3_9CORY|nr:RNA-directed DNA polymerase [Corynebacterium breve]WIM68230.1 RNA-directed DNA polymerase [Corynebacterium breve]
MVSQNSLNHEKSMLFTSIFQTQWLNFIAKESALPPNLTTSSYNSSLHNDLLALKCMKASKLAPSEYQAVRFDGKIRFMELPHPLPYAFLGNTLIEKWDLLREKCSTKESALRPQFKGNTQRIIRFTYPADDDGECWLSALDGNRSPFLNGRSSFKNPILLKLDIANFFPSIYTHALDWAIEGERKSGKKHLGALVDQAYQYSRNMRTDGVAIGPITSNIAAEIILNDLDKFLSEKKDAEELDFRRFVDDIEILTPSSTDIDQLVGEISRILRKYSLSLNHTKQSVKPVWEHLAGGINAKANTFLSTSLGSISSKNIKHFVADLHHLAIQEKSYSILKYSWDRIIREMAESSENKKRLFVREAIYLLRDHPDLASRIAEEIKKDALLAREINGHRPSTSYFNLLTLHFISTGSTETVCWLLHIFSLCRIDPSCLLSKLMEQVEESSGPTSQATGTDLPTGPTYSLDPSADQKASDASETNSLNNNSSGEPNSCIRGEATRLTLLSLITPLVALSFLDCFERVSLKRKLTCPPQKILRILKEMYSGDDPYTDERKEDWSWAWPIRYELFRRKELHAVDLEPYETKVFNILEKNDFRILAP